jgi:FKBP-type peptidyl-prolyl cis-trans isomerase
MKRFIPIVMLVLLGPVISACNSQAACPQGNGTVVTTSTGLKYEDLQICSGNKVQSNNTVTVTYTNSVKDGENLRILQSKQTVTFKVGAGQQIAGLEEGVIGMTVGSKRRLTILPALAYGSTGDPSKSVPPAATLVYDVELTDLKP